MVGDEIILTEELEKELKTGGLKWLFITKNKDYSPCSMRR